MKAGGYGQPGDRFTIPRIRAPSMPSETRTTLADREGDPVRPDLIEFYQRYYHAPRMALAVAGPQTLDQLQAWVVEKFSPIPGNGEAYRPFPMALVLDQQLPVKLRLKPIKDTRKVTFSFPIPPVEDKTATRPARYLSNLLGHEGEGSLLALLKARTWATSLSAGLGYSDMVQASFDITIGLSELGMQHVAEIGELLFAYIRLVESEGVRPVYFEELKQLAELDFRFQEKGSESQLVRGIASRLHRYPPQRVLSEPYLVQRFAPDEIADLLAHMTPDRLQLILVDPALETGRRTPWYNVAYEISGIDESTRHRWSKAESAPGLALPGPNPFIPDTLELLQAGQGEGKPQRLDTSAPVEIWHQTELKFAQPRAELYFSLRSPRANSEPRQSVLTELFVQAVQEQLNAFTYLAYLAGLDFRIYPHSRGFSVRISGYSASQLQLLDEILATIQAPGTSKAQFDLYVEKLRQRLENSIKGRPSSVVMGGVYDALMTSSWSAQEQLQALQGISFDDLAPHRESLLEHPDLLVLSIGNVSEKTSLRAGEMVARLNAGEESGEVMRARVRKLEPGQLSLLETNALPDDAAIALIYQGRRASVEEVAATQLLGALIGTPYYQALRTEGEIGYIVQAFALNMQDTPGLAFSVQSSSHPVSEIVRQTRSFLGQFEETLATMPDQTFIATRAGLIARVGEEDKQLSELANRYWTELDREAYRFDSRERLIDALERLDREAVLEYYRQLIGESRAAALLSYSFGKQSSELSPDTESRVMKYTSVDALREAGDEYF